MTTVVSPESNAAQRREIVFIENNVAAYQNLLDSISPETEVHILDAAADGLAQIARILAGRSGINAIHLISHGEAGSLQLGASNLTAQNLPVYAADLTIIGAALKADGDILLYGCNVGQGESGAQFIGRLAQATSADIAASTDLTGDAAQGGDWQLEYATGNVETKALSFANYQGALVAPVFGQLGDSTSTVFFTRPVAVSSTITLTDPDGDTDWESGQIKVQITANSEMEDFLGFSPDQPDYATFWIDAELNLQWGYVGGRSMQIGSVNTSSPHGSGAWIFTLNANADNFLVQDLVRAVVFGNDSGNPSTLTRTVTFTATDFWMLSASAEQTISFAAANNAARITYSATSFAESPANDGSIQATSIIALSNETFTGNDGDDWSALVSNVPAGLTASLIRNDATHATLSFSGQAVAHASIDDINNLSVVFDDTKFTGGSATAVSGATTHNLIIDFADPPAHAPTIAQPLFAVIDNLVVGSSPYAVLSADLNSDGKSDLVVGNAGGTVSVLIDNHDGSFANRVDYITGSLYNTSPAIALADINSDGKPDLIATDGVIGTVSILTNNGDGSFADKLDYAMGVVPTAITSTDVNNDGKVDLVFTNFSNPAVSVLINNGNGNFASKADFAIDNISMAVTSTDVNGDGKADLIAANFYNNSVSVLIGHGDGSFADKVDYATGDRPRSLTHADVNRDGKPDLIVLNYYSETLSVLTNRGDGTFSAKVDYAVGNYPVTVINADVNSDGKTDLIVTNSGSNTVTVLTGIGDGTFNAKVEYATGDSGYAPYGIASTDVDGDGRSDLIVAKLMGSTVSVLKNAPPPTAFTEQTAVAVSSKLLVSDSDGDTDWNGGQLKVQITANSEMNDILGLPGTPFGENSIWLSPLGEIMAGMTPIGTANTASALGMDPWIFTFNSNATNALVQDVARAVHFFNNSETPNTQTRTVSYTATDSGLASSGTITQTITITPINDAPVNHVPLGTQNVSLVNALVFNAANSNLIRVSDIDAAGNPLEVMLTVAHGTLTLSGTGGLNFMAGDGNDDKTMIFSGTADALNAALDGLLYVPNAGYSGNDTIEVVTRDQGNTGSGAVLTDSDTINLTVVQKALTYSNKGFVEAAANDGSITTSSTITLVNDTFTGSNGDDWSAIVSNVPAGLTASLIRNDATHATLSFTGHATAHGNTNDKLNLTVTFDDSKFAGGSAAAVTGATTNNLAMYFAEPALTTFSGRVDYTTGANAHGLISIDVNNDGKTDLVNANYEGDTISVLLGNGDGSFANKVEYATGSKPRGLTSADVNGDGRVDLIVTNDLAGTNNPNGTISVLTNNGNGTFASKVDFSTGHRPYGITSADVNNDGNADLIVANQFRDSYWEYGNTISVLLGNGNGTFANKIDYAVGSEPVGVASADVNNDGKIDLIVSNRSNSTVSVLLNNGNGGFAGKHDFATGISPTGVVIADVTGDGNVDLITANLYGGPETYGSVSVLAGAGDGSFAPMVEYNLAQYGRPYFLAAADVNGDSKLDLIVPIPERGTIAVLSNIGDGRFTNEIEYAVGSRPLNVASADFNSDGKLDLVVGHYMGEFNKNNSTLTVLLNTQNNSLSPDIDGDGITNATENSAPGLYRSGIAPIFGDGNGDGLRDSSQNEVTSVPFLGTSTAVSNPGSAPSLYVTLVADAQAGLVDTLDSNSAVLTQLKQLDAPADKPANIDMPLGLISFVANVGTPGITETFSLFVDNSIPVNGYFKKNAAGDWVNIATSVVNEPGKTRIDFAITDGGEFDADGHADGIITDPGALGFQAATLTYSTTRFVEAEANDGSITTSSVITLSNDTFTGVNGADWSSIVSNVPEGLTASLIRNDATHATLRFTGSATAHANADDISNLTVTFDSDKFTGGSAANVAGATTSNLLVDFADPPVNHTPTGTVTISGSTTQGQTLIASNDLADADGPATLDVTYHWQADGSDIAGAVQDTLFLDQSLVGKTITVVASYLDALNTTETVASLVTTAVANLDDEASGTLLVTGNAAEGGALQANLSDVLDRDGSTSTSYRWQHLDNATWVDISSATTATLSIPDDQSDVGRHVRVIATTTDTLGGTTEFIGNAQIIANINDAPTGAPSAVLADGSEDISYTLDAVSLLAGFADADGDTLTVANLVADRASVTDNGDGTWRLVPASNYNGPVSLSYEVIDGNGGSLAATQGFSLLAVDDLAVLGSADVTVQETNAPLVVNGQLSLNDIDSLTSFVAQPATGGKYGVFTLGADGAWSYKAKLAYDYLNPGESLQDNFLVKASDGTTSSVKVTLAGTADTTSVHLGDAPTAQSGTGGQWAQAWSQTGYGLVHKADHTNSAEAWSAVKLSGVSSQTLVGGDIYAGDLGVSGQSAATSSVRQEIDGKEALRVNLPTAADSVTVKLSRLYANDDGSAFSESGLLRLLDAAGQVVAQTAFYADSASGAKTVTLGATAGFTAMELIAGAYDGGGAFVYGAYSTAAGAFAGGVSTDAAGKAHGSDFLVDSMDFSVTLIGVAEVG